MPMSAIHVRPATADDLLVLRRALYLAATWRGEGDDWPQERVLSHEYFRLFHDGWGRPGDVGVVAEADRAPVGAAFGRLFTDDRHGYGYIDPDTPEVTIAVEPPFRRRGIGGKLLDGLAAAYEAAGVEALALSVEKENPAVRLYEWHGYVTVEDDEDALLMVKRLGVAFQPTYRPRPGDLERKLVALYPDEANRSEAGGLLEIYGDESWHREVDRVRLAILKLAGGDLAQVARYVDEANRDFRDVIAMAEYPAYMRLPPGGNPRSAAYRQAVDADAEQYLAWVRGGS